MVKLKREADLDKFPRNESSYFQAIGAPSVDGLRKRIEFADSLADPYDWGDRPKPKMFRNLLMTAVCVGSNKDIFKYLKDLKDEGVVENIMLDSGGFQVLTGSLEKKGISNLDDLQRVNEELYNEYDWADIYIMPDHPPNLSDVYHDGFKKKVDSTIEASLKFFEVLKPEVQAKVAPVFHLRKDQDINYLYNAYKPMLDKCKFASYSASSLTMPGSPRQLRDNSLVMLDELQKKLSQEDIGIHCLGIASPAASFILQYLGIRTYDSSTPIVGAGLGKIYFPYVGGVSCSAVREGEPTNINEEQLQELKRISNHRCPFCDDFDAMYKESGGEGIPGYLYRIIHNFCVLDELNWLYRDLDLDVFAKLAPNQHKDLIRVRNDQQFSLF